MCASIVKVALMCILQMCFRLHYELQLLMLHRSSNFRMHCCPALRHKVSEHQLELVNWSFAQTLLVIRACTKFAQSLLVIRACLHRACWSLELAYTELAGH
jgi:hypothetical protein